ncbi:BLUF domain-containing protein [Olleya aquimaris]|uniref:BLUF domain-containing protein n=1 Tax=Olleya sediminilitoris TaxID=2795739 RepID=A0ABS1WIZ9_9FLAO|nr:MULTISPECIES: BLUF domain-containing protein [Olleya]AXO81183.1 BLUF domain-containing protein [Olleya aquimaris]MBL7559104.1 BLUF domain-containing protein [Olleya sediminilitoris]
MLKTICYKSEANSRLELMDFEALFNQTQLKNDSHNITGVLVKKGDLFFQILEGNPIILDTVYEDIKKDHRHSKLTELLNKPIKQLNFKSFDIGYSVIKDTETLYSLQSFIKTLQDNNVENSDFFFKIIESLLEDN